MYSTHTNTDAAVRRTARRAGLLLGAGLLLAACGGDDGGSSPSSTAPASTAAGAAGSSTTPGAASTDGAGVTSTPPGSTDEAGRGCTADTPRDDLTMATALQPTSLDPAVARGSGVGGGTELLAIYDTLMTWNPDTETFEPRIAESAEPNDDASVWTVTLRDGVTFGNGDPLTSASVKSSVERFKDPASVSRWTGLAASIASIDTPDERTVVFTLTEPWGTFPYILAHEIGMIVNTAVVDELGAEAFSALPAGAGAGPFEVQQFTPGEGIVMQGKDDYWAGPVCIEELKFVTLVGAAAAYDAFRAGEVDAAWMRDPKVLGQASDDGYAVMATPQNGGSVLMMNAAPGRATGDVAVRQAVAKAIVPAVMNDRIADGRGIATDALFGEASRLFTIAGPSPDTAAAAELVEAAKANGFDGTVHVLAANDPQSTETALTATALLEAAGFTVEANYQMPYAAHLEKVVAGDFDIVVWGLNIDESAPWPKLDSHLGNGSGNYWSLDDAELDAAILATKSARDVEEMKAAVTQLQTRWNEIAPGAVYATVQESVVSAEHVRGLRFTQEANVILADVYIER